MRSDSIFPPLTPTTFSTLALDFSDFCLLSGNLRNFFSKLFRDVFFCIHKRSIITAESALTRPLERRLTLFASSIQLSRERACKTSDERAEKSRNWERNEVDVKRLRENRETRGEKHKKFQFVRHFHPFIVAQNRYKLKVLHVEVSLEINDEGNAMLKVPITTWKRDFPPNLKRADLESGRRTPCPPPILTARALSHPWQAAKHRKGGKNMW